MIVVTCPSCLAVLRVSDDKAGSMGKCPKCQAHVRVPAAEASRREEPVPEPDIDWAPDLGKQAPTAAAKPDWRTAPPPEQISVPNYGGVQFLGTLYIVLGYIACTIGGVVFLEAATRNTTSRAGVTMGLLAGGGVVITGLMMVGFGQLFHCIRDMAQNSFRLRGLSGE